jgi:hypothetical protein
METDIFSKFKAISQVIFDPMLEFLILINSDIIYKYYYPKTGLLINKEILLEFSISKYGLHAIYYS